MVVVISKPYSVSLPEIVSAVTNFDVNTTINGTVVNFKMQWHRDYDFYMCTVTVQGIGANSYAVSARQRYEFREAFPGNRFPNLYFKFAEDPSRPADDDQILEPNTLNSVFLLEAMVGVEMDV